MRWPAEDRDDIAQRHREDSAVAPKTAAQVSGKIPEAGGGWSFVLSDLKTLLETGKALGS